jgi:spermidine synthase
MFGVKILEEKDSKYNGHLRVVRSLGLGTYIQAGGLTQSGGVVGTIWKPVLKKVKGKRQEVKEVLILGLGGGTAAKYIRLLWPESKITGVDIDPIMVELGNKYLGLDKVNVDAKIADAYGFNSSGYDLVIVDLYNGDQFPRKFEDGKFLKRLTKNKLVIFNRLYFGDKRPEAVKFGNKLQKIFSEVTWFYPEANLMFICRDTICQAQGRMNIDH